MIPELTPERLAQLRKLGVTIKPPMTKAQVNALAHHKAPRNGKRNRYLPNEPLKTNDQPHHDSPS